MAAKGADLSVSFDAEGGVRVLEAEKFKKSQVRNFPRWLFAPWKWDSGCGINPD